MHPVLSSALFLLCGAMMQYGLRSYEIRAMLKSAGLSGVGLPGGNTALRAYLIADAISLWTMIVIAFHGVDWLRLGTGWSFWVVIPLMAMAAVVLHVMIMRLILGVFPWMKRASDALYDAARVQLEKRRAVGLPTEAAALDDPASHRRSSTPDD